VGGELHDGQISERWNQEVVDDLGISFMRARRDLFANRLKPSCQPLPYRDSRRIDVLVGIEQVQQAPEFFFRILSAATNCCCRDPPFARSGIGPQGVAQLE